MNSFGSALQHLDREMERCFLVERRRTRVVKAGPAARRTEEQRYEALVFWGDQNWEGTLLLTFPSHHTSFWYVPACNERESAWEVEESSPSHGLGLRNDLPSPFQHYIFDPTENVVRTEGDLCIMKIRVGFEMDPHSLQL